MASTLRVLIVEDDQDLQQSLKELLQEEGFEVRVAGHGRTALRILKEGFRPEVILLDLMMPVMDGWEFRALILEDPELADIPVVITTALAEEYCRLNKLRAAAYLRKPHEVVELLDALARHAIPVA